MAKKKERIIDHAINTPPASKKKIALALQGAGAHGAITWGVLERLLEEEELEISAISASSSGAMNAAVMLSGLGHGGVNEAKRRLECFWRKISNLCDISPLEPNFFEKMIGITSMPFWPVTQNNEWLQNLFTPYQLNFFDVHPLRDILEEIIDFADIRKSKVQLMVNACDVLSGENKVFSGDDMKVDHLLASACLPYVLQRLQIDGRHYWDALFTGNPGVLPLLKMTEVEDIAVVRIIANECATLPRLMTDVVDRADEISNNYILMQELCGIDLVNRILKEQQAASQIKCLQDYRIVRLHMIENEPIVRTLSVTTKMDGDWKFLNYLREVGRQTASDWLKVKGQLIGKASTWKPPHLTSRAQRKQTAHTKGSKSSSKKSQ